MHVDTTRDAPWPEACGCELSPSCEVHRAAADLGAALQAAVIALSARMPLTNSEPANYFAHDSIGREIAAALHKAGLVLLELPSGKMVFQPRHEPASELGRD